ncbi:MAG: hypothetical protein HP057_04030, partial [Erysipelatoclostridium sp.]|nr:hypothetical protein [Thomasclavelia sp.]
LIGDASKEGDAKKAIFESTQLALKLQKGKTLSFLFQIMKIASSLKKYVRMYFTIREEEICH